MFLTVIQRETDQETNQTKSGYLPHNGVATITQFIEGTTGVFGMGVDLSTFLAVYGAVFDGDLVSWSIGGPAPATLLNLGGILGTPEGISGSHNKYEADASPTRPDLYQYGNDYKIIEEQWSELYAMQENEDEESSNYDLGVLTSFRGRRFNQSVSENPYFFNAPFSGVIVQPAAYTFIYRFMANKSEEFPEGRLSKSVLKSFFGVSGEPGNWTIPFGYERIPDNWYKRNLVDQYSIPFFALDLNDAATTYPEFLNIGGNLGKTNTFAGVDITNITGGLYNLETLAEGNNAMCFVFELLIQMLPDLVEGLLVDTSAAVNKMMGPLTNATAALGGCQQLNNVQQSQFQEAFKAYPGYANLKADGTYGSGASEPNGLLGIL